MREDRSAARNMMLVMLLLAALLLYGSYNSASRAVTNWYAPYNAQLTKAHYKPLDITDAFMAHTLPNGQKYPTKPDSTKLAQLALEGQRVGPIPLQWAAATGFAALVLGGMLGISLRADNPRRNLINLERDRIRLRSNRGDTLPIVSGPLGAKWGLMRRDNLKAGGRRELGNLFVFGAPGRGKSSMLKWWLTTSDLINFIVVDLKGDLWRTTAGHRATLGHVIRLDLTSMQGDAIDPLATNDEARARAVINAFLPTGTGDKSDYFNTLASEIALMFWRSAKTTQQSPTVMMVRAATLPNDELMALAADLVQQTPEDDQNELLRGLKAAFGQAWDDPNTASAERNSVIQSFKGGFAPLNTPEILSTLATTTFDPAELVDGRATLYISAPSTEAPYKTPIEVLLAAVILGINQHVDISRQNKQGEDIVILADEAGILKIPLFADTLAGGRSRGLSIAAFLQTMGQLDQYHKRGWRGLVDTAHHWVWFSSNDPDVIQFLRHRCGVYDKRNPNRDPEVSKRQSFIEVSALDELSPKWKETEVMSLLDFDRKYMVFGSVVNPYGNRQIKRLMALEAPDLPSLPKLPVIQLPAPATVAPKAVTPKKAAQESKKPVKPAPEVLQEDTAEDDERF